MKKQPNPGSQEAIDLGCKCPVIDNHHGEGFIIRGEQSFWYNGDCDLHGSIFKEEREKKKS